MAKDIDHVTDFLRSVSQKIAVHHVHNEDASHT